MGRPGLTRGKRVKTNKELAALNLKAALRALERGDLKAARNLAGTARDDLAKAVQAKE